MTAADTQPDAVTAADRSSAVVAIDDLVVDYSGAHGNVRALDGASLRVAPGERLAVVGESGSGKSTLGAVIGRLLAPAARIGAGRVEVDGRPVLDLGDRELRTLRRETLGFIAQDPISALDPTMRIGRQLALATGAGRGRAARQRMAELLDRVQIPEPERVLRLFPHQVSGGMAQRVVVAMAMARRPRVLVADEPTAALDTQVRDEVLRLLFAMSSEAGTAVIWLSHDLGSVSRWCERTAVMYGGRVVEDGPTADVLADGAHPYTAGLAASDPRRSVLGERLRPITGSPPVLTGPPPGCAFVDRCHLAVAPCADVRPEPVRIGPHHTAACHRAAEVHAGTAAATPAVESPAVGGL
ncbi:MAG: ABC transporter ATP-binding protein [Actinomycetota bacterium]|nr:ABC transporter ATP-binding protein [Actinomycetota bacterium]